jgi:hypothetical protein
MYFLLQIPKKIKNFFKPSLKVSNENFHSIQEIFDFTRPSEYANAQNE